jgi:hypothetical protein
MLKLKPGNFHLISSHIHDIISLGFAKRTGYLLSSRDADDEAAMLEGGGSPTPPIPRDGG